MCQKGRGEVSENGCFVTISASYPLSNRSFSLTWARLTCVYLAVVLGLRINFEQLPGPLFSRIKFPSHREFLVKCINVC